MMLIPGHFYITETSPIQSRYPISCIYYTPDEIYHLRAQSHVRVRSDTPGYTGNVTAPGTPRILEAECRINYWVKFYQASFSGMFGAAHPPRVENTACLSGTRRIQYGLCPTVNSIIFRESPKLNTRVLLTNQW